MLFGGHKGMSFFNEVFNNFSSSYYSVSNMQGRVLIFSMLIELIAVAIALSILVVLKSTHSKKTERYICIKSVTRTIILSSVLNLIYYLFLGTIDFDVSTSTRNIVLIYFVCKFGLGIIASTTNVYASYAILKYILSVLGIEKTEEAYRVQLIGYLCVIAAFIISFSVAGHSIVKIGSDIEEYYKYIEGTADGTIEPLNCISKYTNMSVSQLYSKGFFIDFIVYTIAYVATQLLIVIELIRYRKLLVSNVFKCIIYAILITSGVVTASWMCRANTANLALIIPLIVFTFLIHPNSYDIDYGTLDTNAFISYFDNLKHKDKQIFILAIYLSNIEDELDLKRVKVDFRDFTNRIGYNDFAYKINQTTTVLINENPFDVREVEKSLREIVSKNKIEYKMVLLDNISKIDNGYDYLSFYSFMRDSVEYNMLYKCTEQDLFNYTNRQFIRSQLDDIVKREDINDNRVLVYCQPVLNVEENKFTSAEALMRLELTGLGIVYPDRFIELAEKYDNIHTLTKIILNKTCKYLAENKDIQRISVNVSSEELKDEKFCDDIIKIIESHNIDISRVAIEVTESRSLKDFNIAKERINKLKAKGIKIYLDDFGTGYSNFERIMELPIDIIKFDRSLVILANDNTESRYMVSNFAGIFSNLGYEILFEGIETKEDEEMCKEMKAKYLQGYKYSKPIPIEQLSRFT